MIIDIDWVIQTKKRLAVMNNVDIDSVKWMKNGDYVEFSKEDLEKFKLTGLNNTDIIGVCPFKAVEGE